ncbi:secretin N-terminal domain-containing protein [Pirellulaceae bacterium SH467]
MKKPFAYLLAISCSTSLASGLAAQDAGTTSAPPATQQPSANAPSPETTNESTDASPAPIVVPPIVEPPEIIEPAAPGEKVLLQFRDQDWQTALSWLAAKLALNLDWKELPTDKLSLSSTQELSLDAVEDLFNMQLLARGFVLLKRENVLRLVSLKDLDITLVPRVEPEELSTLPKHSIARVSFPLDWMIADEAANELKPLLSPYGKVSPMSSANRLEVVDAVVNLREFHRLLIDAEKDDSRKERVAEFRLTHRRVEDVAPKVRQLLGLPPDSASNQTPTQLDVEQTRFKAEAMKQLGRDARELIQDNKKVTIYVVVNEKENSLLVNAPPNKIEIVRQAVEAMDKPLADKETAWETISRVKVYDVAGFEPDAVTKLVASLQERGTVGKDTRIQHEAAYNRIIVFASPEDQLTVAQLIESFRSEKRTATVLPLANVDPTYAAKAVQLILKSPDRPSSAPGVPSDGKFQIEPDPQNNRLLLWATPGEVTEVREFLARLGETFSEQRLDSKLHVIDMRGQDTSEITEKLKRIWAEISDSPLLLDLPVDAKTDSQSTPSEKGADTTQSASDESLNAKKGDSRFVAAITASTATDAARAPEKENPPVRLMQNGSGDLVVLSKDPIAAETAKRLIDQLLKDGTEFRAIALKHSQAFAVRRQLETMLQYSTSNVSSKLTSAPQVVIDVDTRTNRLIIQNANEKQWKTIKESIEILDQPNPEDEKLARERVTYRFQHRKASVVAKALEGVYEDLLRFSERSLSNMSYRNSSFNRNIAATTSSPEYQGLLAISVDEQANLMIISAPKYLLEEVLKLVESMDTPTDGNAIAILNAADLPFSSDSSANKASDNLRRLLRGGR